MRALSATALGSGGVLSLAEPLAYSPDLLLSVQSGVDHQGSLKDLFQHAFDSGSGAA